MPADEVTWENTIKEFFTQSDIGCMRGIKFPNPKSDLANPKFDLASYESVVHYKKQIFDAVYYDPSETKPPRMPKQAPPWPLENIEIFKKWMNQVPPPRG